MGDREKASLRLQFNPQIRLELHGATITSDAGLLAFRELDDALDLTPIASDYLQESRTGRNIRHHLVPLLRQSIYSRLAGYDDTNDAERLSQDPAMRVVVGWQGSDRNAARTNTMSRFETETLTQEDNLKGLALMNPQWVELAMAHTPHRRVILDMDSSESPVHGQQEGAAYNGHFGCVCYHPLFLFNQFGDCEGATLRPGNVHSADGWQELLEPVVKGYQKKGLRLLFRGDAAFAKPELYEYLEQGKIGYAIRIPANQVIQEQIQPLLERPTEWPSREPIVSYHDFAYQAQSWHLPRRVVAKVEWHQGDAISQGWFHRDQPELSTQRNSPLLQWPWHGGAVDQGGQVRPELDPAFLPQVRGQPGETMAVRPDLQPGQLYEKAGVAGGYEALDSDQSSDQADQDGWATGTPRKEAGVSACRGVGNQGNADRDIGTDQPASAGTWLACFESTGISDSYGVVRGK